MTGPIGKSEFCYPLTSMFPLAFPRETLRVLGKQNSLFQLGPVIKCLLYAGNMNIMSLHQAKWSTLSDQEYLNKLLIII